MSKLNKQNKFVKTAIAAAALGFLAITAQAASVTVTPVVYAVEQFLGTTPGAAVVAPSINVVALTAIPANSTITVAVQLTGGKFGVTPVSALGGAGAVANQVRSATNLGGAAGTRVVALGSSIAGSTAATAGVAAATTTTNNADAVYFQLTTDTAVGIGATVLTIDTASISATGLATTGATVTATASIFIGTIAPVFGGPVPSTSQLEASSSAATVASSAAGVVLAAAPGTTTQRIDLTITNPGTKVTAPAASATSTGSAILFRVGTYSQTDSATAKLVVTGNGAYTAAAKTPNTSILTLTAPAGYFAPVSAAGLIEVRTNNTNACGGTVLATAPAFATAAAAAAATSAAFPAFAYTSAAATVPLDICITIPAANTLTLSQAAPSLTSTLGVAAAQDSADQLAATALTALATNGSQSDVKTYLPAALSQFGYQSFVRVINTGSVPAVVSGAFINQSNGVAGSSFALTPTLAAGASVTLTGAQIEAVLGAPGAGDRPRLRLTAPTGSMTVQYFLQNANGSISELSSSQ